MATISPLEVTPAHTLSESAKPEPGADSNTTSRAVGIPRGDVDAVLNYYKPPEDGAVPFNYVEQPPEGEPQRNYGDISYTVTIHDVRGRESEYNLDKDAFAVISGVPESAEKDFVADESITNNYYPEVEKLLLENVPGSTKVVFFDHTIRRVNPNAPKSPGPRTAVTKVHIDQTARAAKERVKRHLGAEAEKLLQGRYRIINVWRPLNGPIVSFPLGFASSGSVKDEDVIPIEHRYPTFTGQTAAVRYNPGQKWHYLSGIRNDERVLLECFDSEGLKEGSKVQGGRAPHSAFADPRTPADAAGRESIEVRALVFGP